MLIYVVYSQGFESNAKSLRTAIKNEWSDSSVNLMGAYGKTDSFAKYQIQIDKDIIYSSESVTDNTTIINLIKENI